MSALDSAGGPIGEQLSLFETTGDEASFDIGATRGGRHDQQRHRRGVHARGAGEVAELFEIVGQETDTIARLDGCLDQLRAVQHAKALLAELSPTELRAALRHRHLALLDPTPEPTTQPTTAAISAPSDASIPAQAGSGTGGEAR